MVFCYSFFAFSSLCFLIFFFLELLDWHGYIYVQLPCAHCGLQISVILKKKESKFVVIIEPCFLTPRHDSFGQSFHAQQQGIFFRYKYDEGIYRSS